MQLNRQQALALCLGVQSLNQMSKKDLSAAIDKAKENEDDEPCNPMQIALAKCQKLRISRKDSRSDVSFALWDEYEDDPDGFFENLSPEFLKTFLPQPKRSCGCGCLMILIALFILGLYFKLI